MEWVFKDVHHLVFSGGGVRGLAFIGALHALREEFKRRNMDLYQHIHTFCGTSAGALIATMASLNMTWEQMATECMRFDGSGILQKLDFLNFGKEWGLHNKSDISKFLQSVLCKYAKVRNSDVTFEELHEVTGKTLIISATRLNDRTPHFFSVKTTPKLEVWRAATASMSIPLIFTPSRIGNDLFIDGGMLVNLPLEPVPLEKTLAFLLVRDLPHQIQGLRDYLMRVSYIALDGLERAQMAAIPEHLLHRIVRLNTGNVSSIEFGLEDCDKWKLIMMGAIAMMEILDPFLLRRESHQLILHSALAKLRMTLLANTTAAKQGDVVLLAGLEQQSDNNAEKHHQASSE